MGSHSLLFAPITLFLFANLAFAQDYKLTLEDSAKQSPSPEVTTNNPPPQSMAIEIYPDEARRRAIRGCDINKQCGKHWVALRHFEQNSFNDTSAVWIAPKKDITQSLPNKNGSQKIFEANHQQTPVPTWLTDIALPDLPVRLEKRIIRYLEFYKNNPRGHSIMAGWLQRQNKYKALIDHYTQAFSLPKDLLYLAMIESSYRATTYSRVGASGLWQFMPGGGRIYGLRIDRWVDERNDPIRSTQAAMLHLSDLYQRFGSWELALAAYNAGYGAILKGIARYNTNDYWQLIELENALPWESSIYVPKILAAAIVGKNRELFGFDTIVPDEPIESEPLHVRSSVALSSIAKATGTTLANMVALNPHIRRGRTPPGKKGYVINVPIGGKEKARNNTKILYKQSTPLTEIQIPHGYRFEDVATTYGVTRKSLLAANAMQSEAEIRGEDWLIVPARSETFINNGRRQAMENLYRSAYPPSKDKEPLLVASNFAVPKNTNISGTISSSEPATKTVYYRVIAGTTLQGVAEAFEIDKAKLVYWNSLDPRAQLQARMILRVLVPVDFDAVKHNIAVLDPNRLKPIQRGTTDHIVENEMRLGRKRLVLSPNKPQSFAQIGKPYGLSSRDVARINKKPNTTVVQPGEQVIVYQVVDASRSKRAAKQRQVMLGKSRKKSRKRRRRRSR